MSKPKRSAQPLPEALTAFTDAGRRSQTAAVTWKENTQWKHQILQAQPEDSLQTLELFAVVWAFLKWQHIPLNIVSDSLYVVGIANRIEDASLRELKNRRLSSLLISFQLAINQRTEPYAVLHIRSHQWNEGLGEGNARADRLVATSIEPPLSPHCRARESHAVFHQNARGLAQSYNISLEEARAIVKACTICSHHNSGIGLGCGVNPRGLKANAIWQMDVTHVSSLGRLKYLHVTIDTYSHMLWATPQPGEKVRDVRRHLTSCFAVMGVPATIKTDNGPAYSSGPFKRFLQLWDITHVTGIPYSPTGQAIVERANGTIKKYLDKFKDIPDVRERVNKTLFVLNYLCVFGDSDVPPALRHHLPKTNVETPQMKVLYKDSKTGLWKGPVDVIYIGRGCVCVSTPTGTLWVPSQWVKPVVEENNKNSPEEQQKTVRNTAPVRDET